MSWETSSITFVKCDGPMHVGDPVAKIETGFNTTARAALIKNGWSYLHDRGLHFCPACVKSLGRAN
jgi:hypothetical protein